jgi:anion-transporting  ArsA/GET3 family ATPase
VRVKALIVNQIVADDSASAFVDRVARGQVDCMRQLESACDAKDIHVTRLPFFDTEVRGLPALRALGVVAFADDG